MFGHIPPEDFVSLLEAAELPARDRAHLDGCPQCQTTWAAIRDIHNGVAALESEAPAPDWESFRSSVRDELLSRAVQRQTAVRRWTGWAIRPAAAWALSLLTVAAITTVTVFWGIDRRSSGPTAAIPVEITSPEPVVERIGAGPEKALFDDVVSLGADQEEAFRELLKAAQEKPYEQ